MCKLFQTVQWVLKISIHAYTSLTSKTESEKKKFPSQPGEENRAQIRTIFRLKKFTAYENFIIKKYWVSKSYLIQQKKGLALRFRLSRAWKLGENEILFHFFKKYFLIYPCLGWVIIFTVVRESGCCWDKGDTHIYDITLYILV